MVVVRNATQQELSNIESAVQLSVRRAIAKGEDPRKAEQVARSGLFRALEQQKRTQFRVGKDKGGTAAQIQAARAKQSAAVQQAKSPRTRPTTGAQQSTVQTPTRITGRPSPFGTRGGFGEPSTRATFETRQQQIRRQVREQVRPQVEAAFSRAIIRGETVQQANLEAARIATQTLRQQTRTFQPARVGFRPQPQTPTRTAIPFREQVRAGFEESKQQVQQTSVPTSLFQALSPFTAAKRLDPILRPFAKKATKPVIETGEKGEQFFEQIQPPKGGIARTLFEVTKTGPSVFIGGAKLIEEKPVSTVTQEIALGLGTSAGIRATLTGITRVPKVAQFLGSKKGQFVRKGTGALATGSIGAAETIRIATAEKPRQEIGASLLRTPAFLTGAIIESKVSPAILRQARIVRPSGLIQREESLQKLARTGKITKAEEAQFRTGGQLELTLRKLKDVPPPPIRETLPLTLTPKKVKKAIGILQRSDAVIKGGVASRGVRQAAGITTADIDIRVPAAQAGPTKRAARKAGLSLDVKLSEKDKQFFLSDKPVTSKERIKFVRLSEQIARQQTSRFILTTETRPEKIKKAFVDVRGGTRLLIEQGKRSRSPRQQALARKAERQARQSVEREFPSFGVSAGKGITPKKLLSTPKNVRSVIGVEKIRDIRGLPKAPKRAAIKKAKKPRRSSQAPPSRTPIFIPSRVPSFRGAPSASARIPPSRTPPSLFPSIPTAPSAPSKRPPSKTPPSKPSRFTIPRSPSGISRTFFTSTRSPRAPSTFFPSRAPRFSFAQAPPIPSLLFPRQRKKKGKGKKSKRQRRASLLGALSFGSPKGLARQQFTGFGVRVPDTGKKFLKAFTGRTR